MIRDRASVRPAVLHPGDRDAWPLDAALRFAEAETRRHSSTFSLGARVFGPEKRRAVSAVYAACRAGDDAVDEAAGPADARERLEAWWAGIERAYDAQPDPSQPTEVALAWVVDRWDVPRDAFLELKRGFESDLRFVCVADTDELLLYARRVAGVVGLMIAPISGYDGGDATLDAAVAMGEAMQITNILRDVGEDLHRGRCYLPVDRMAVHGVDPAQLRRGDVDAGYVALLEEFADLAAERYRQGWDGIPKLHGLAGVAVGVAAMNYEAILAKLRANRYDNLSRRAHLRTPERLAIVPRAAWAVATARR